jgi:hypothetical protein
MQSPVSVQLAPDSASTMVNCTIKSEEKKEPCHEAPQGAAPAVETQPGDPALASQDATNAKAPPQVPSTLQGPPGSVCPLRRLCGFTTEAKSLISNRPACSCLALVCSSSLQGHCGA